MAHDWFTLEELSRQLGRDLREIEKLVNRGRIPGHKRGGVWTFQATEVTQWLEQEMRTFSDPELSAIEESQASPELNPEIPVTSLMKIETVQVPLDGRTRRSILEGLVEVAGRTYQIWEPATVLKAVLEREELMSTAFDSGVAIPHPRQTLTDAIGDSVVAFGRTTSPIPFGAANNSLTDMFFLVICRDARTHLHVLARLGRMLQQPGFIDQLREAPDSQSAYQVICETEARVG
ncbi:MAG: helix-turn-helix domain-containing protein [Planctomycetota bacterium]|jgi:PTS system nitrogen regulatory IIA component|nr:MAG: helix-turn-helix domain-containing protein [Planctomycetota bacterium]